MHDIKTTGSHMSPASGAGMVPGGRLDVIGRRHGTDKAGLDHAYLDFYERFLRDLRDQPVKVLEIGVLRGQSVMMWRDYFSNGQVIGVDINPQVKQYECERLTIEIADQSNVAHLVALAVRHGPFDLIVDDGSHFWNHQITTLQYLYPFVKPGMFFILEDIHTSFGDMVPQYRGVASLSAMDYLQKMAFMVTGGTYANPGAEEDSFLRTYAPATEFIAFHRHTALLRRHDLATADKTWAPTSLWARPTALLAPRAADLISSGSLTAHLGFRGDVSSIGHLAAGLRGGGQQTIQGFSIDPGAIFAGALQYRALRDDGAWTEWVTAGAFVGTRGEGRALQGFAARLTGPLAADHACVYAGSFVGEPDIVTAEDGAECRGRGSKPMEAMEIGFRRRSPSPA